MKRVGIIAEDVSDVDVIGVLVGKIAKKQFRRHHFVGNGHGKILQKCRDWSRDLQKRGCSLLIIVHDLDTKIEKKLRESISNALKPCPIRLHVVVIPIREIEAWLLADHDAIRAAFNLKCVVKKVKNPEALNRPKEHLRDLVYRVSSKTKMYVNTIHNIKIAEKCRIANLRRCPSFEPMAAFVEAHL